MINDIPIRNISEDKFGRLKIVKRLESIICNQIKQDSKCFTIGIFAKWGEGKTSVLNMLENLLTKDNKSIEVIRFDPWFFKDMETLFFDFFNSIKGKTSGDKIRKAIGEYGSFVSLGAKTLDFFVPMAGTTTSEVVSKLVDYTSHLGKTVKENKEQINKLLKKSSKHFVIMIDDVDRLDRDEIHSVFNLVKQVASFDNVTYVIAADKEIVAKSLASEYEGGGAENNYLPGYNFLEKIFQLQIDLPKIDAHSLWNCFNEAAPNLFVPNHVDDEVSQSVQDAFESIRQYVFPMVTTYREILLYSNMLSALIPMVYNEVNLSDLCLLESLKIFCEQAYVDIKNSKSILTGDIANSEIIAESIKKPELLRQRRDELMNKIVGKINGRYAYYLKYLIVHLLSNYNDSNPSNSNCLLKHDYFDRYFMFGVPENMMSDEEIKSVFICNVKQLNVSDLSTYFQQIIKRFDADELKNIIPKSFRKDFSDSQFKSKVCVALALLDENSKRLLKGIDPHNANWEYYITSLFDYFPYYDQSEHIQNQTNIIKDTINQIVSLANQKFALIYVVHFISHPRHMGFGIDEEVMKAINRFRAEYGELKLMELSAYSISFLFPFWKEHDAKGYSSCINKIQKIKGFNVALLVGDWFHKRTKGTLGYDQFAELFNPNIIYSKLVDVDYKKNLNDIYVKGVESFLKQYKEKQIIK